MTMIKDTQESEDFTKEIKENLQKQGNVDMSVNVLTSGSWPIAKLTEKITIPIEL